MKNSFSIFALLLFGFSVFAQNTDKLVDDYINIKSALVDSDFKTTSKAIDVFSKDLKAEKAFSNKEELVKSVDKMVKATTLEKQREGFYTVSTLMWELVESSKKLDKTIYYQYCPMAKGYWLSNEKEVVNPYYGASLLNCGKVVETKK